MALKFKIDSAKCVKCGACAKICPCGVLQFDKAAGPSVRDGAEDNCMHCQHCFSICATGALSIHGLKSADALPCGNYPPVKQLESLMQNRRSCRAYKQENVEPETIKQLLRMMAYAPTGCNVRGLHVSLIDDINVMADFRKEAHEILFDKAEHNLLPKNVERFKGMLPVIAAGGDPIFRTAPHALFISSSPESVCADQDAAIALSYFELIANAYGLGTVFWGIGYWLLTSIAPEMCARAGIPENYTVRYAILFGKPAVKFKRAALRPSYPVTVIK